MATDVTVRPIKDDMARPIPVGLADRTTEANRKRWFSEALSVKGEVGLALSSSQTSVEQYEKWLREDPDFRITLDRWIIFRLAQLKAVVHDIAMYEKPEIRNMPNTTLKERRESAKIYFAMTQLTDPDIFVTKPDEPGKIIDNRSILNAFFFNDAEGQRALANIAKRLESGTSIPGGETQPG